MNSLIDLQAPAKLNVFLRIVGRRDDGYHLMQSLFVMLDWHDTLHLERRGDGQLQRHDLAKPLPADDLCLRAARALQAASGCTRGADISILKRLPAQAGMGGGSSDAATVLIGLNRLWGLNWSRERLSAIGVKLGADVPFFLGPGSALVEGIGERLSPIDLRSRLYAVVKPAAGVETRRIFTDPALRRDADPAILEGFLADPAQLDKLLDGPSVRAGAESAELDIEIVNDLQPVAMRLEPEVGTAIEWLKARWGQAQMTGSGSAVFARETAENAPRLAAAAGGSTPVDFPDLPTGWQGRICRSLVRHPLWEGESG